jgi:hypothetical protein
MALLPTVAADRHRRHVMFHIQAGSYVVHAKLPELGSGEIVASEKGCVRIRFASGERNFNVEFVAPHLTVTVEAPAKPAASTGKKSKAKSKARASEA